ncbi:NUDIX hydrolase [Salarchaeum japonicum]|uniref:NUDIX hydrolase n=1 Tax=Salarchaeum japonicum TaxID=555573 RepID=UPI003C78E6AD
MFPDTPREPQTVRLAGGVSGSFREWATDGTALTAAARVRDPDGRLAFVKNRWSDGWVVPGGAVEPGETPSDAARREVREETGLDADIGRPLVVLDQTFTTDDESFDAEFVVFDARADGRIPDATELGLESDEIRAARWFDEVPDALHDDVLRRYLE